MSTLVASPKPPTQPKPPKPPKSPTFTPPRPPRPQNTLRKLSSFQAAAPQSPTVTAGLKTPPLKPPTGLQMPPQGVTPKLQPPAPALPTPQPAAQPQQNNFMGAALKGLIPWKTVLQGGLPMVAGLSGLLRGQNTLAPLFEGPDNASKTAAYRFGQQVAVKS